MLDTTTQDAQPVLIPTLAGDVSNTVIAINDSGLVIGQSLGVAGQSFGQGYLYDSAHPANAPIAIPLLHSDDAGNPPVAISSNGKVLANSFHGGSDSYIYDSKTGAITALPNIDGSDVQFSLNPVGINSSGQAVGNGFRSALPLPFLYQNEQSVSLARLLPTSFTSQWKLDSVAGINDSGLVVANATRISDGIHSVFLLTPH